MSVSAGIYELRPLLNTNYALSIADQSKNTYALAVLRQAKSSNNSQKFKLEASGNAWYITPLHSGKSLATKVTPTNGGGIGQYPKTNSNWCKWTVTEYQEHAVVNNTECAVVGIFSAADGTLCIDYSGSSSTSDGRVVTKTASNDEWQVDYQKFALVPTYRYYAGTPVPYDGAMSIDSSGALFTTSDCAEWVYPSFRVPSSWLSINTYLWRYRVRDMGVNGIWGDWTAWSWWMSPSTNLVGDRVWITSEILHGDYYFDQNDLPEVDENDEDAYVPALAKHRQFNIEVCCSGLWSDGYTYYGPSYSYTLDICRKPSFTLSTPVMTPDGLHVAFSSNYSLGSNRITILSTNGKQCEYPIDNLLASDELVLPTDSFGWFANGSDVALVYACGNDQHPRHAAKETVTLEDVSYTGGSLTLNPSVSVDEWGVMTVTVKNGNTLYPNSRVWVLSDVLTELGGSDAVFTGFAPNGAYTVFATAQSGSSWGAWSHEYATGTTFRKCHAIATKNGDIVVLGLNESSPIVESHSLSATYDASSLDAREFQAVRFAPTLTSTYECEGALVYGVSTYTIADIDKLVGQHATYRSPSGRICDVAIVSVSTTAHATYADVSVSLVEETV